MKSLKIILVLTIGVLLLNSCKKDRKDETPLPTGPATTTTIHISGVVVDAQGWPISGVEVKCGTKTATTDYNGAFAFFNFVSPIEKCVITFHKANFFTGVKTFRPEAGKYMPVEVTLLPFNWSNASTAYFNSTQAYTMYVGSTGCEIDFPANNWVVESTGAIYSGDLTVYAAFLDPTDVNYGKYAYGGLMMGKTATAENVYLEAHTGLVVEIYGNSGEKLNLDPNAKASATIRFQIPAGLVNAPSTIEMWDFDMAAGIAGAGGSAAKSGDKYVGQAQHFSYWSCEKICSGNPATIKGKVTDGSNPIPGVPVLVGSAIIFTDINGNFSHIVPAGIQVSVGIKPGFLGVNQNPLLIGPLSNDEVYNIPSDFVMSSISYINGQLVNCTGTGIQGHVMFNSSGYLSSSPTSSTGHFSIPITTAMMYGYLTAHGNTVSEERFLNISTYPYNAGTITLCPPIPTGPNEITINGSTVNTWTMKEGSVYGGQSTSIYLDNSSTGDHVSISFIGTATGTYQVTYPDAVVNGTINGVHFESASGTITVTSFGAVGQLINGTFSCVDGYGSSGSYTGKFSVQREDFTFKK
jgi:hypothetical protein